MFHGDPKQINPGPSLLIPGSESSDKRKIQEQIIIPAPDKRIFKDYHYQSKDQCVTLKIEQKIVDGIRYLLCSDSECSKKFKKPNDLIRHFRSIHKKERITCAICLKSFSLESTLKKHILIRHKSFNDKTSCNVCQKKFNSVKKLQAHMEIHNDENSQSDENSVDFDKDCDSFSRPYQCLSCPMAFKEYKQLKQHEASMHMIQTKNSNPIKCDVCNKEYSSISALNLHKKLHEKKVYKCNICEVTMTTGELFFIKIYSSFFPIIFK
jgi:hypothetical protein